MDKQTAPDKLKNWAVPGVADHPQREALYNELHARPAFALRAPARLSHIALLSGEQAADQDREHVAELCRRFGAALPNPGVNFWRVNLGPFWLSWERHTEFSNYTFIRLEPFTEPFDRPVIEQVPTDWLAGLAGQVLVATHLALETRDAPQRPPEQIAALFASDNMATSEVADGAATAWTDFRLQGDGFGRILVHDNGLAERQASRLVQRLLEIETYRMMALLSLPLARGTGAEVSAADQTLARLTARMADPSDDNEAALFEPRAQLASEVERLAASTNYRFSASRAYYTLVQKRIQELREKRIPGRATIQEFMERRLAPAMRTCESVAERIAVLSERISRASDLLRTRVDLELEQQNRDLLASMNRRAELQLRLQETVEGLSVVVLSYYLVGLVAYALKGMKAGGIKLSPELLTGLAVPVVVVAVWLATRALRRHFADPDHT